MTQTTSGQGPDLPKVNQIRTAFQRLDQQRTRIALLDCLLAVVGAVNRAVGGALAVLLMMMMMMIMMMMIR